MDQIFYMYSQFGVTFSQVAMDIVFPSHHLKFRIDIADWFFRNEDNIEQEKIEQVCLTVTPTHLTPIPGTTIATSMKQQLSWTIKLNCVPDFFRYKSFSFWIKVTQFIVYRA